MEIKGNKEYQLNVDTRILELLGPNLYTNIYLILFETKNLLKNLLEVLFRILSIRKVSSILLKIYLTNTMNQKLFMHADMYLKPLKYLLKLTNELVPT